jgi:hypothetical protein
MKFYFLFCADLTTWSLTVTEQNRLNMQKKKKIFDARGMKELHNEELHIFFFCFSRLHGVFLN